MRLAVLALIGSAACLALAQEKAEAPLTRIVEVVHDANDAPVAGATVEAWGLPGGTVEKRTGADGIVRFENMPRKGVVFVARKPGYCCDWHEPGAWSWAPPPEDRDPDGDGITRTRLALEAGTVVQGHVRAKDGETPIAGAVVEAREVAHATDLRTLQGAPLWTAATDAEGRFRTAEPPRWCSNSRTGSGRRAPLGWSARQDSNLHLPVCGTGAPPLSYTPIWRPRRESNPGVAWVAATCVPFATGPFGAGGGNRTRVHRLRDGCSAIELPRHHSIWYVG